MYFKDPSVKKVLTNMVHAKLIGRIVSPGVFLNNNIAEGAKHDFAIESRSATKSLVNNKAWLSNTQYTNRRIEIIVDSAFENAARKAEEAKKQSAVAANTIIIKGLGGDFDGNMGTFNPEKAIAHLHRAAGKNCLALPGISENDIANMVIRKGITTINGMVEQFYRKRKEENNYNYHFVTIPDFVLAMGFEGIVKSNVKEFATGIFDYLVHDNVKFLSQLKGKRLANVVENTDAINDARLLIEHVIANATDHMVCDGTLPTKGTIALGYTPL